MSNNNSDEEFISIEKIIEDQSKDQSIFNFPNFNDVIREDHVYKKDNENIENKDKYFYQPQFKDIDNKNLCEFKIVGYNEKGNKPEVKMGEFILLNDKWLVISHLYNIFELNHVFDFKKRFFDIFSLVLNKDNLDIVLSLRYIVIDNLDKYKFNGKFIIIFKYKKSEQNEELLKIKELDGFPGFNKGIEFLIKELSNPNIIENYEW